MPKFRNYRVDSNGLDRFAAGDRYWLAEGILNDPNFDISGVFKDWGKSEGESEAPSEFEALSTRMEELRKLETGWLDGTGEAPDLAGLDWLHEHLDTLMRDYGVPFPRLYPTTEGGIQAEWEGAKWEIEVEYHLTRRQALVSLFRPTDADRDKELSVGVEARAGVMKLALLLREHLEAERE